jgi:hypothetical protein
VTPGASYSKTIDYTLAHEIATSLLHLGNLENYARVLPQMNLTLALSSIDHCCPARNILSITVLKSDI